MSCVTRSALRSLSLSYPKKDWRAGPCKSFFGYVTDYKIALFCFQGYILYLVSYQKKDWRGPARQSFFWYDNDKDRKAHFLMTQVVLASVSFYLFGGSVHSIVGRLLWLPFVNWYSQSRHPRVCGMQQYISKLDLQIYKFFLKKEASLLCMMIDNAGNYVKTLANNYH